MNQRKIVDGKKVCPKCNQTKLLEEFSRKRSRSYIPHEGCYQSYCRDCTSQYYSPEKKRRWDYSRRYDITLEEYQDLYAKQKGACAICKDHPNTMLCIDHDHIDNFVRGLLCSKCNLMIGNARNDINILEEAINYLERNLERGYN